MSQENVIQVVTDNASNCRKMGRLVEAEFKHIRWTPCASHCLNLLIKDIGKLDWVKRVVSQALSIVNFFTKKVKVLAIFREHSTLELKKPASTRFAYMWLLLERLYDVHATLQVTVVCPDFVAWLREETGTSADEARAIQRLCMRESFWTEVRGIVIAVTPIYRVLRMTDMEGSTLGLLTHFMREALAEVQATTILDEPSESHILDGFV